MDGMFEAGRRAALRIWADADDAPLIVDPRRPEFANGVIAGLSAGLAATPGVMRKVVGHAAAAAEDLNVEAFQGLVEVLQNADDLNARSVRFALSTRGGQQSLLIVHDGAPVTCHHVLAMTLPYLTTKTGDADQKGRFGIGLKTLRRISSRIAIHSAPYHFSANGLELDGVAPADGIPGFYEPSVDTMLALDLVSEFSLEAMEEWFDFWDEDGLLFLKSVRRFAWRDLSTGVDRARLVDPGDWSRMDRLRDEHLALSWRRVIGSSGGWIVYRAEVPTPEGLDRSHKATGPTTTISVALADHDHAAGLFLGLRTRIPISLPFSIDAQFDPSTAREGLIANTWNRWLIARCGDVIADIGLAVLRSEPPSAWAIIPLEAEGVGISGERWPRDVFHEALVAARSRIAAAGAVLIGETTVALADIAYEDADLAGLLTPDDIKTLASEKTPLTRSQRDPDGRWRQVLGDLGVSTLLDTHDVADGFSAAAFDHKPIAWWVNAGDCLAKSHPNDEIFGIPCWKTDLGKSTACSPRGETARPLLVGEPLSEFAHRWALFDRLDDHYANGKTGAEALQWLNRHAAVAATVDAADELEAFAELFANAPFAVEDADLVMVRDRFDLLTDRRAEPLGLKVGKVLLLDAFVYRNGKRSDLKASPSAAYLSRTLDSDYPYWPDAAGVLPGITWLAPAYDIRLKSGATRSVRKRADGTISRAARKFLMLLGAVCSPRVVESGRRAWGGAQRTKELRALGAEFVQMDHQSPDLDRVLASLDRASKRDRKARSAALMKALSRYWDTSYADKLRVQAHHQATKHTYIKGEVTAGWLCRLQETRWVAVGAGSLSLPSDAVVKSAQTQMLYAADSFVAGVMLDDLRPGFSTALKLITDVRASDLVMLLEQLRSAEDGFDPQRIQQAYRSLAKLCPNPVGWNTRVGDLTITDLRQRFSAGDGLIWVPATGATPGRWRRPDELFIGRDIFLDPERFVPGGPSFHDLWNALQVRKPTLDACIAMLRSLSDTAYTSGSEAILIEVYRYLEPLVAKADRRQRERFRALPVGTVGGTWAQSRPVYRLQNRELAAQLAKARLDLQFWLPPCDVHALPNICIALGLIVCTPDLELVPAAAAAETGEVFKGHFQRCVDHLSNELARNDPATRERLSVPWAALREAVLFVYAKPFEVLVNSLLLSARPIAVPMRAVITPEPLRLHVDEHALAQRENCGRAIASLFPPEAQRRIEAEWVASWVASTDAPVEMMQTASDEELTRALADRASATALSPGVKIKVTPPASRSTPSLPPRRLKGSHGGVSAITIVKGAAPKGPAPPRKPLANTPPAPPPPPPPPSSAPAEYSLADLEQRGWEILSQILNTSQEAELLDFRRRHGVGADGVINWKTFVELKATGRAPQGSVEMSATEFERAKERGLDFMIALVSGLEEGHRTEVRLILDPANRATVRPIGSIRLVGLAEAPSVLLHLSDYNVDEGEAGEDGAGLLS